MAFLALSLKMYAFMPNKKIHPGLNVCIMNSVNDSMGILLIQFQIWDLNVFTCLTEESAFEFCQLRQISVIYQKKFNAIQAQAWVE